MEEFSSFLLFLFTALFLSPVTAGNGCSVEEEYEKDYVTPEQVAALRDWVSTQPHLPGEHITDRDLVFAFNSSSGCLDDARQKLDHYFTVRTMFTDLFKDRVQSEWWLNNTLNFAPMFDLPQRSKKGYKTLYLTFNNIAENFDLTDICKYVAMVTDLRQYKEGTWPGMILIVDVQNFTECHIDKMKPLDVFQKYFYYYERAWLGHMEGYHYINLPEAMCDLKMVLQDAISESFLKKVYIHKNMKSFKDHFPIAGLPKEAGGKSKSIKEFQDYALKEFKENQAYFIADRKKTVDETKRPGGPKNISQIMQIIKESLPNHHTSCDLC